MAKELPYFQFEPAEYLTGNISFCSLKTQGLFINLCSYYWQRSCNLTKQQLLKRLDFKDELEELLSENVIEIYDDIIKIKFLDEQISKATMQSKANSLNGSKGGRPKKESQIKPKLNPIETEIKPKQKPIESQLKGIREDKIIEDKIIEDKSILDKKTLTVDDRKNTFSLHAKSFNNIYEDNLIQEFIDYWTETNPQGKKMKFEMQKTFQINLRLKKWYSNSLKFTNNGKTFNNSKPTVYEGHKASYESIKRYHEKHNPFAEYDD